jgi:hypothetical protein
MGWCGRRDAFAHFNVDNHLHRIALSARGIRLAYEDEPARLC